MPRMKLFCIPYAGGNAWSYRALEPALASGITLEGLELPGRGRRAQEPLSTSLEELADDLFQQICQRAATSRYAIYGHSMGALLAFLTAHRIRSAGLAQPDALFVSGSDAPASRQQHQRHLLPLPQFLTMLRELGGCPPQVLEDRELLNYFEPILRADFTAVETWARRDQPPLTLPLVVMVGTADDTAVADAADWALETTASCRVHEFGGDHFFILDHWDAVGATIQQQLLGATTVST